MSNRGFVGPPAFGYDGQAPRPVGDQFQVNTYTTGMQTSSQVAVGRMGDTWYLDEVFVKIQGRRQYLWRAVDQDGDVVELLAQPRRDRRAAERFFRKPLKGQRAEPLRIVTDKLRGYGAAHQSTMPSVPAQDRPDCNKLTVPFCDLGASPRNG